MVLDVDLSQIEWRIKAFLAQEPTMLQEIRNSVDQHAATCTSPDMMALPLTKDNRQNAKIFNFRAIYCRPETAPYAYYMDPDMPNFSQKRWETIIEGFFKKYNGLLTYHKECVSEVRKTGQLVGPTGRIWKFQKVEKRGGYKDYSEPQIYNYPTSGTAADIIKLAIVVANKRRLQEGLIKSLPMIAVHDSYVWDTPEEECESLAKIVIETFREIPFLCKKHFGFEISCPITGEASFGKSWGEQMVIEL
jgi:DNA polymerase-1